MCGQGKEVKAAQNCATADNQRTENPKRQALSTPQLQNNQNSFSGDLCFKQRKQKWACNPALP